MVEHVVEEPLRHGVVIQLAPDHGLAEQEQAVLDAAFGYCGAR